MIVRGQGIALDAPEGWDARISRDPEGDLAVVHLASFALPAELGGFGGEAIDRMPDDGIVISVLEYEPSFAEEPLFGRDAFPPRFRLREMDPAALTHARPLCSGAQRFAVASGRPLCVYLVVGVSPSPARLVRDANRVIASLWVSPREGA